MSNSSCPDTFTGKHSYLPRRTMPDGPLDQIMCICGDRPTTEQLALVQTGLAATAAERARQANLSRKQIEQAMAESGQQFAEQKRLDL